MTKFKACVWNQEAWHRFPSIPGTVCLAIDDPDYSQSIMIHVNEVTGELVKFYRGDRVRRFGEVKRAAIEHVVCALWVAEQMGVLVEDGQLVELPLEIPTHDKWWLREVHMRDDGSWLMFGRQSDRGIEFISIMVQGGKAWPVRAGQRQSMKRERRERVQGLAAQAIAYVTLMGGGEDFPPVDEI